MKPVMCFLGMMAVSTAGLAEVPKVAAPPVVQFAAQDRHQAIVQIGGRHCEYRRSEVEGALRQFDGVQQVDFLNNHGTVKVVYRGGAMAPEELALAVERALAMGWGCKAWIERAG